MPGFAADVFLIDGFFSVGECRFLSAHVDGDFRIVGATLFPGKTENCLVADRSRLMRSWVINDCTLQGELRAIGAWVELTLGFDDVAFIAQSERLKQIVWSQFHRDERAPPDEGEAPEALSSSVALEHCSIGQRFRWRRIDNAQHATLNLSHATTRILSDDSESWPAAGNLLVEGFTYEAISSDSRDARSRLDWLSRQREYVPQPYEQLTTVFRASGWEEAAKQVGMAKQERRRKAGGLGFWSSTGSLILKPRSWTSGKPEGGRPTRGQDRSSPAASPPGACFAFISGSTSAWAGCSRRSPSSA